MPSHTMSWRWLCGYATCFILMLPLLGWSWHVPAPYGDLTRVGRFTEAAFGWQARQPAIAPDLLQASPVGQADVLVIGDSFSNGLRWQSVLVAAGWRVATVHWDSVGPLCADFEPWLRAMGFQGRTVVLQRVERALPSLVAESAACRSMPARALQPVAHPSTPPTEPPPFAYQWQAPLDTGPVTAWRTWRATKAPADYVVHDAVTVRVASVPGGCAMFTHTLCQRALFLADDLDHPPATPAQLAALPALARSRPGLRIVWAVTPNKSTIYLQPERAAALGDALQTHVVAKGEGIDLFSALLRQRHAQRDLYYPNDTHFSNAGFLFMGRQLATALGPPPAH